MGRNDKYPLHTGYLTKSPPEDRFSRTFKRWKKRWFVLWENKKLEYYKKRGDTKAMKTIDLNRCECLDSNLSDKRFKHIFSLKISGNEDDKTNSRIFYLAAETSYEMTNWIQQICKLCDFEQIDSDDDTDLESPKIHQKVTPVNVQEVKQCPLSNLEKLTSTKRSRDSGIIVTPSQNNSTSYLHSVMIPSPCDDVPPPRQHDIRSNSDGEPQYSASPLATSPPKDQISPRNSCSIDVYFSAQSSLSSLHRQFSNAGDCDPENATDSSYDDLPPPRSSCDYPPRQNYDVPRDLIEKFSDYDVPRNQENNESNYDFPPDHSSNDGNVNENAYDIPRTLQSLYDTLPASISASQIRCHTEMASPNEKKAPKPKAQKRTYVNLNFPVDFIEQ